MNEEAIILPEKEEDDPIIKKKLPKCEFNKGVGCEKTNRRCVACGWNPIVAEKRKAKIYAERGVEYAN